MALNRIPRRASTMRLVASGCRLRHALSENDARPGKATKDEENAGRGAESADPSQSRSKAKPSESPSERHGPVGSLAQRLEEATEEALLSGGRAGQQAIRDAGFSEELRASLLARLASARPTDHVSHMVVGEAETISAAAGPGTRALALSQPWDGRESMHDAVLRALDDAQPRLRTATGPVVDIRPDSVAFPKRKSSAGQRVARAQDLARDYTNRQNSDQSGQGLSPQERTQVRELFRDRFDSGARSLPASLSGMEALANRRIEEAMARGQFKNLPRGMPDAPDTRSSNPFIDTTEFIMNKMIQTQEILPPWIEKQQQVSKSVAVFRENLRASWFRQAAHIVTTQAGNDIERRIELAKAYRLAEERRNPRKMADSVVVASSFTEDAVMKTTPPPAQTSHSSSPESATTTTPTVTPLRDPGWLRERESYFQSSVDAINAAIRSYNLMAPDLAKKPYVTLDRELDACHADVAHALPSACQSSPSATTITNPFVPKTPTPKENAKLVDQKNDTSWLGGLWSDTAARQPSYVATVREAPEKQYGLRELLRDWWTR